MKIVFHKYHGTGNDFIVIDDRKCQFDTGDPEKIAGLCDRRFGIGADGLILLREDAQTDFEMVYFNSDGKTSSMCGNGGRCIVHFAHSLGLFKESATFRAIDGTHQAVIRKGIIELAMNEVGQIEWLDKNAVLDTGSPHFIEYVDNVDAININKEAHKIRYSERFKEHGINVNFVELKNGYLNMRTYERGVEGETYSCGTGVVAAAIATAHKINKDDLMEVKTRGGDLKVRFERTENGAQKIWLIGPASFVYRGEIDC